MGFVRNIVVFVSLIVLILSSNANANSRRSRRPVRPVITIFARGPVGVTPRQLPPPLPPSIPEGSVVLKRWSGPNVPSRILRIRPGFTPAYVAEIRLSEEITLEYLCATPELTALRRALINPSVIPLVFDASTPGIGNARCVFSILNFRGLEMEIDILPPSYRSIGMVHKTVLRARLAPGVLSRPLFSGTELSVTQILESFAKLAESGEDLRSKIYALGTVFSPVGWTPLSLPFLELSRAVLPGTDAFQSGKAFISQARLADGTLIQYASRSAPTADALKVLRASFFPMPILGRPPLVVSKDDLSFVLYRVIKENSAVIPDANWIFELGLVEKDTPGLFLHLPQGGISKPIKLSRALHADALPDNFFELVNAAVHDWHMLPLDELRGTSPGVLISPLIKSAGAVYARGCFKADASHHAFQFQNGMMLDFVGSAEYFPEGRTPYRIGLRFKELPFDLPGDGDEMSGVVQRVTIGSFEATVNAPLAIPLAPPFSITFQDKSGAETRSLTVPVLQKAQIMPFIRDAFRRPSLLFGTDADLKKEALRLTLEIQKLQMELGQNSVTRVEQLHGLLNKLKKYTSAWSIQRSLYRSYPTLWSHIAAIRHDFAEIYSEIMKVPYPDAPRVGPEEEFFAMINSPGHLISELLIARLGFDLIHSQIDEFYELHPRDDAGAPGAIHLWFLNSEIVSAPRENSKFGVHAFKVLLHFEVAGHTDATYFFTVPYNSPSTTADIVRDYGLWKDKFLDFYNRTLNGETSETARDSLVHIFRASDETCELAMTEPGRGRISAK